MDPVLIDSMYPPGSYPCEPSSVEGGQQASYAFSSPSAPRAQEQQLLRFRRTHPPRQLSIEGTCWEYLLSGQGKDGILLLPGWPCIAEWNFERLQLLLWRKLPVHRKRFLKDAYPGDLSYDER